MRQKEGVKLQWIETTPHHPSKLQKKKDATTLFFFQSSDRLSRREQDIEFERRNAWLSISTRDIDLRIDARGWVFLIINEERWRRIIKKKILSQDKRNLAETKAWAIQIVLSSNIELGCHRITSEEKESVTGGRAQHRRLSPSPRERLRSIKSLWNRSAFLQKKKNVYLRINYSEAVLFVNTFSLIGDGKKKKARGETNRIESAKKCCEKVKKKVQKQKQTKI